ncbi:UvrB/UvrC motif-containing protein, partial [bacterium]|nr:UvrB/UvrC motif-containing protein [bacterium]
QLQIKISKLEKAMLAAAKEMQFELAAALRDKMYALKSQLNELIESLPIATALEISSKKKKSRSTRGAKLE